ncbi:MAG: hypothetical protein IJB90_01055 [Clostridia bacterium]|nr:hypothetical protein [Clostridia bacterium]
MLYPYERKMLSQHLPPHISGEVSPKLCIGRAGKSLSVEEEFALTFLLKLTPSQRKELSEKVNEFFPSEEECLMSFFINESGCSTSLSWDEMRGFDFSSSTWEAHSLGLSWDELRGIAQPKIGIIFSSK